MENKKEGVCYICGEPLVWDENDENCSLNDYMDDEEDTVVKEIRCKRSEEHTSELQSRI